MTTPDEPWTIGRLLSWTADYLAQHGAENPRLDAEVLLAEARGCRRIDLYAAYGELADDDVRTTFRELVRRRATGTPVAYLVGRREFYALEFEVTPDVLIPRSETELLVVALLDHVKGRRVGDSENQVVRASDVVRGSFVPAQQPVEGHMDTERPPVETVARSGDRPPLAIADVGTGSGVLAVCAAKYVPNARVTAIDVSPAALAVARRNAKRHGVAEQIEFVESDLFTNLQPDARFDYIISNPPYVSTTEMAQLSADVHEHEPHMALHAGERGIDVVAPLIEQAAARLNEDGVLCVEVSPMIATEVERLVREQPHLEPEPTLHDLAGHARVVQARFHSPPR